MVQEAVVSIIVPTYNRARFVGEAIESALAQTYRRVEIIVVDDGSRDDTAGLLRGFGNSIRVLSKANGGVSKARNLGIGAAEGQYLMFLDSDDRMSPEKVEAQVDVLESKHGIDVVYCMWEFIDAAGRRLGSGGETYLGRLFDQLLQWNFAPFHAFLFRRKCLDSVRAFRTGIEGTEDWDYLLRVAAAGHLHSVVERCLVQYRMHAGNASSNVGEMLSKQLRMLRGIRTDLKLSVAQKRRCDVTEFMVGWNAACTYFRHGRVRDAERAFQEAFARYPDAVIVPQFFEFLADCLEPAEHGCCIDYQQAWGACERTVSVFDFFAECVKNSREGQWMERSREYLRDRISRL